MAKVSSIAFTGLVILLFVSSAWANESREADDRLLVMLYWAQSSEETLFNAEELFNAVCDELIDTDFRVEKIKIDGPPTVGRAEAVLDETGARIVFWRDAQGRMFLLVVEESGTTLNSSPRGMETQQAQYLRSAIERFGDKEQELWDALLTTVPTEITEEREQMYPVRKVAVVKKPDHQSTWRRAWVGAGYRARFHFDDVTWTQQGMNFDIPTWFLEPSVALKVFTTIYFPARIGDTGQDEWLEIRSVTWGFGLSVFPWRKKAVALELGLGFGTELVNAKAVFSTGQVDTAKHVSGLGMIWVSFVWRITPGLMFRAHFDSIFAIYTPVFSMYGNGDFGSQMWQPMLGFDLNFAVFGQ